VEELVTFCLAVDLVLSYRMRKNVGSSALLKSVMDCES